MRLSERARSVAVLVVAGLLVVGCSPTRDADDSSTSEPDTAAADGVTLSSPDPDDSEPSPVEPADPAPTEAPVSLTDDADFGTGVSASVESVAAIDVAAQGPGEVSGPGIVLHVDVRNDSDAAVDLSGFLVNVFGSQGSPGVAMFGAPAESVPAEVAPGETVSGVYVFTLPVDESSTIRVEASYSTEAATVVFEGPVDS